MPSREELISAAKDKYRQGLIEQARLKFQQDSVPVPEPDLAPMKDYFNKNLSEYKQANTPEPPSGGGDTPPVARDLPPADPEVSKQKEATSFLEAMEAGWQMSVEGLIDRGKLPDTVLPENAPMYYSIASSLGQLKGDIPDIVAGSIAGAGAGTAVAGPIGALVGAGAGGYALPEAVRQSIIDGYKNGSIKNFSDFWERASSVFLETSKAALVGGATAGVGAGVSKVLGPAVISPLAKTTAKLTSEVATMTTVGAGLEGRIPEPKEFLEAGVVIGGLHASGAIASKLYDVYGSTGVRPAEVALDARKDIMVRQDLGAVNRDVPLAYKDNLSPEKLKTPKLENLKPSDRIPETPVPKEVAEKVLTPREEALNSAQDKILSQIGKKPEKNKRPYTKKDFYKDYIDKYDPTKQAIEALKSKEEILPADKDPYVLSRVQNDSPAKTKYALERGTLDYKTLETNGEGFAKAIEPILPERDAFNAYIVSKRALEQEAIGKKTGFDLEAAKTVVKEGARFEKQSKEVLGYQNRMLKYLKDSGFLSEKSYESMVEAGKNYVPFKRIFDSASGVPGGKEKPTALKSFKGSERAIQDPLVTIVENTEAIFKLAETNRASRALVEFAEKSPEQTLLKKVNQSKPITVSKEEIAKASGLSPEEVSAIDIFRNKSRPLAKDEFQIYRNGQREVWKTADPNLAEAIRALDGDAASTNMVFQLARSITSVKRYGIAITPDFIAKNLFRDQLTAGSFSESGYISFVDVIHAAGDIIKKTDNYYNWLKSGGAQGAFLELNESYIKKDLFKLNEQTGFADAAFNVVKKPFEILRLAAEVGENATRLAEFKRVSKGASSGEGLVKGGFASREITVDFQRVGAKMSALNSITAFQNVSIQGLDRTIRAFKADPKGLALRAGALLTAPSVMLWWANRNDQRVQDLPAWQKNYFWIIATDDWREPDKGESVQGMPKHLKRTNPETGKIEVNYGSLYRIPKPQELGLLFATIPERILDGFFQDNPQDLNEFMATVGDLVTPAFVPDAISPVIEQFFNKSLFTGAPIIPRRIEGLLAPYQYTEYSSETAKQLGKLIGHLPTLDDPGSLASPAVIDNYIRGWTGTLGAYVTQAVDQALIQSGTVEDPVKPAATLSDIPFLKAFAVRYPNASLKPIQDFREIYRKTSAVQNTFKTLVKAQDPEAFDFFSEHKQDFIKLDGINKTLNTLSANIRKIYNNKGFTKDDKRQMIDKLYYGMLETSREGNNLYNEVLKKFVEENNK